MPKTALLIALGAFFMIAPQIQAETPKDAPAALDFTVKRLNGKSVDLKSYKGKVLLVVNVASECGLTPQYAQLQEIYAKYQGKGLAVLGFPCNQFGRQEPGTAKEIQEFCKVNYGVKFDMFAKVDVNGEDACDFYKHLTSLKTDPKGAGKVGWNFEKFVIDRHGNVIGRFSPQVRPDAPELIKVLEGALAAE